MPQPRLSRNATVGAVLAVLAFGIPALTGPGSALAQSRPLDMGKEPAAARENPARDPGARNGTGRDGGTPEAAGKDRTADRGPRAPGSRPATPRHRPTGPLTLQDRAMDPKCSWTGERIVSLLVREDAESAERFYVFYTRFDCPPARIADAFSCVLQSPVAGATADSAGGLSLASVAASCWSDPTLAFPLPRDEDKPAPPQRKK